MPDAYFRERVDNALRPGMSILDVGAGHEPTILPSDRPFGCVYVGLDVSEHELRRAPAGSYDEWVVNDLTQCDQTLLGRFDLIVSFQVFEHVQELEQAIENLRSYLRPGGLMIAMLTGKLTHFAILNRVLPRRIKLWLLHRFHGYDTADIFPAYYDRCYDRALRRLLRSWSQVDVTPFHLGASYLSFLPPLCRAYLVLEDWACRGRHDNLASNYVIRAVR